MKQYAKFANEISALSFSPDGTKLAIGISYEHDNGISNADEREKRQLLIKTTVMDDCRVRERARGMVVGQGHGLTAPSNSQPKVKA